MGFASHRERRGALARQIAGGAGGEDAALRHVAGAAEGDANDAPGTGAAGDGDIQRG